MTRTVQLALELPHRPALGREDFLVSDANRAAVEWIDRWPEWSGNGLVLFGPAGAGKSHLAEVWLARSGGRRIPADVVDGGTPDAIDGNAGAVAVDDADRGRLDEEALLHLYNALRESGGHLLLTARRAPAHWPLALNDLRSRLLALPAVALAEPDDALMAAVVVKTFADRQLEVAADAVNYLVGRIERSFAAAHKAVADLDSASLARRRRVTVPFIREHLSVWAASERE